ncbi:heparin lyase I family protein [Formosa haliotis]|uniref:heparin lyase I family protein n=1 Tax=Formosa haliotis TaxID=1555194 RepID=UPI000B124618|nr:heparin lyase I family protein [Formosa haliotis]
MKKLLFICLWLTAHYIFVSCNDDSDEGNPPVLTDISVSTTTNEIHWTNSNELTTAIEEALTYHYGEAKENEVDKPLTFNTDTTQVIASIAFKPAFENVYTDENTTNNAVTITLVKTNIPLAPVTLQADGPGETYELITSVLAPGANPIETPDCNHADFGRHIDEVFDNELNAYVFRFHMHTSPDNDRCINFDRQRNEIKTYDQSPENLKGTEDETVVYKWKFKLDEGFQSSSNFTHIHQLKSVGGDLESMPIYTLTTRKSNPDRLELRYAETDKQITLAQTPLAPLTGVWLDVTETITYSTSGNYKIEIKNVNDDTVLFSYAKTGIVNWRPGASFVRPKWGIYRSLINENDLRDETLHYTDFSIQEVKK